MKRNRTIISLCITVFIIFCTSSCRKSDNENIKPQPTPSQVIENNLKAVLDSVLANTHVPGLVAGIWAPNEGVDLVYAAGVADLETEAPMSADMIFRIASNTKTFSITVLLQLVDEGLLSLDDLLSKYFPDFPRADEVTIEMLANMQSGIFDYYESEEVITILYSDPTHLWTSDEIITIAALYPYYFDPGTGYHYSNTNTILVGMIIKMVTGMSLEYNISTRIIDPLNLVNTVYLVGGTQIPGFHSCGYYVEDYDTTLPELSEHLDVSRFGAAGSMVSKLHELRIFAEALTDGTFLSVDLQQKRMNCLDLGNGAGYGMGLLKYNEFYGHNGEVEGFTSLMMNAPTRNCTIVIWYNCDLEDANPTSLLSLIPKIIYSNMN